MMTLYLLRHGIAVERGAAGFTQDSERPLTGEGKQKLRRVIKAARAMELEFDLILTSPYLRARQTAELIAGALRVRKNLQLCPQLVAEADPEEVVDHLKLLNPAPENVLLVGHEPYLSRLISLLLAGTPDLSIGLKKGGLCKLTIPVWKAGPTAILDWLLTPRQMALMR
jgi:phosphohistidine phosphatase